jgi:biopolymer transport protein ExbB
MDLTEKFLTLALYGANWVLWILVALSVFSVAVVIERFLFYRGITGRDTELAKPLHSALGDDDLGDAKRMVEKADSPGARMVSAMLQDEGGGVGAAKAIQAGSAAGEKIRLERNLSFLGTVGANAPFIGLFGTVLEILRVFNLMGREGITSGDQAMKIMTGISEALVATAIGLLVAIPAVVAYNAFQRRVKRLMSEADGLTSMTLARLESRD